MSTNSEWVFNRREQAILVALDISGFSRARGPNDLLSYRADLFRAVESTELFPFARDNNKVRVLFLGDELRLGL